MAWPLTETLTAAFSSIIVGSFVPGEYMVGLLAGIFLNKKKARIIHDPRVIWNTIDIVGKLGGEAIVSKTGHAFVKAAMRNSGCDLRWRNVGASLFQGFFLLR